MKREHTIKKHSKTAILNEIRNKQQRGFELIGKPRSEFNEYYGRDLYYAKMRYVG